MDRIQPEFKYVDPIRWGRDVWPDVKFYKQQQEVIYSIADDDETYVPAGNMLGKDFVAGFVVLWFFLTRYPCRIITTSAKDDHLRVLWGEINRFIQTANPPLDIGNGGPLIVNHHELKRLGNNGEECPICYVRGMVAAPDRIASMQGHHVSAEYDYDMLPRTLFVADEASGVPHEYYTMASTWAKRILVIGNPWPCENFFKHAVTGRPGTDDTGGDVARASGRGYYRRVIQIKAEDSPNVRFALKEIEAGKEVTNTRVTPGVLTYEDYMKRRKLWDKFQQCVSLDGQFYEGAEIKLFPNDWLDAAERYARQLLSQKLKRIPIAMGVDTAQGGDNTAWVVVDRYGIIEMVSKKTPDTSKIVPETLALMHKHKLEPANVLFDAGGGGREHVDRLRAMGYRVRAIAFGAPATPPDQFATYMRGMEQKQEEAETRYVFKNRRAEMYGLFSELLRPVAVGTDGAALSTFGFPRDLTTKPRDDNGPSLRNQLNVLPKWYDEEGRLYLPPKQLKPDATNQNKDSLIKMIGCSPDESDAAALAVFGMVRELPTQTAGVA